MAGSGSLYEVMRLQEGFRQLVRRVLPRVGRATVEQSGRGETPESEEIRRGRGGRRRKVELQAGCESRVSVRAGDAVGRVAEFGANPAGRCRQSTVQGCGKPMAERAEGGGGRIGV